MTNGDTPARKAVLQNLVHEVRAESRKVIKPVFRLPAGTSGDGKVRKVSGSAHLALHNTNLSPLVVGPAVSVAGRYAKVRRDGYRRQ